MLFDAIFLGLVLGGWLLCAYAPWVILSVATRGEAGLRYLPLSLFTGLVAALAVPLLGLDDGRGLVLSFVAAFVAPALLLAARRFSLGALPSRDAGREPGGPRSR